MSTFPTQELRQPGRQLGHPAGMLHRSYIAQVQCREECPQRFRLDHAFEGDIFRSLGNTTLSDLHQREQNPRHVGLASGRGAG